MAQKEKYREEDALKEAGEIKTLVGNSGSREDYDLAHEMVIEQKLDRDNDPEYIKRTEREIFESALEKSSLNLPIKGSVFEEVFFKRRGELKVFKSIFDKNSNFSIEIEGEHIVLMLTNKEGDDIEFGVDFEKKKLMGDLRDISLSDEEIKEIEVIVKKIQKK